jgi:outer membrane biosynthesis protein TonB
MVTPRSDDQASTARREDRLALAASCEPCVYKQRVFAYKALMTLHGLTRTATVAGVALGLMLPATAAAQDPTSAYTNSTSTSSTTPAPPAPKPTPKPKPKPKPVAPVAKKGVKDTSNSGTKPAAAPAPAVVNAQPAAAPQRLAYTGGEPLLYGAIGVFMMLGAAALAVRRRTTA